MNTIFNKVKDIFGLNESEYEYYEEDMEGNDYQPVYQPEPAPVVEDERQRPRRTRERPPVMTAPAPSNESIGLSATAPAARSNVIGMPGSANGISEVVVIEPRSFEEMPQVIQALRERKSVVLNLTIIDPDEAQRAVDFVAGGTYAIDGHQERIGESIFLFTPSCVQVSTQNTTPQETASPLSAVRASAASMINPNASWSLDPNRLVN